MGKDKIPHKSFRHNPLHQQILEGRTAQTSSRKKIRSRQAKDDEVVDNKLTKEIVKLAGQQQEEIEEEAGCSSSSSSAGPLSFSSHDRSETEFEESSTGVTESGEEFIEISEEDERAFNLFMSDNLEIRATITDNIKEKLTEKQTEIYTVFSDSGSVVEDDKLLFQYKELAPVLHNYRSGPLPKAFKTIPKFSNWEHILSITEPEKWTDAAMFQATRLFSANLGDKMAQRFYNLFLLPRCRDEISETKKLNFPLYQALKKALFKPAAFFRGIIIPLCKSGNCTLREATIFGSVLSKCSIPVLHSSAALLTIAEMGYTGVNSIFMRVLIEKKYALPYRAVAGVVEHFLKFMEDTRQYPLFWHQCLLTFVQIYKIDLSKEQKSNLLKLLTVHKHEQVTPEIRKELEAEIPIGEAIQMLWKM